MGCFLRGKTRAVVGHAQADGAPLLHQVEHHFVRVAVALDVGQAFLHHPKEHVSYGRGKGSRQRESAVHPDAGAGFPPGDVGF